MRPKAYSYKLSPETVAVGAVKGKDMKMFMAQFPDLSLYHRRLHNVELSGFQRHR